MFQLNIFEAKFKEINTKMTNYEEHMEKVANIAYSKSKFTELIEALLKFKSLGSNYA